jgi:hypothetical protein
MKKETFISKRFLTWVSPLMITLCCVSGTQAHAKDVDQKVKEFIDRAADNLKQGIDKLGDDMVKAQEYLENYAWKGIVQDRATSGAETLSHLKLNKRGNIVVARPGEVVQGKVVCSLDSEIAHTLHVYRVVIGIDGEGPQTSIGTSLGAYGGSSEEKFSLKAPMKPGMYQIRFRTTDNILESRALDAWIDEKGDEPGPSTTIGIIYVKA